VKESIEGQLSYEASYSNGETFRVYQNNPIAFVRLDDWLQEKLAICLDHAENEPYQSTIKIYNGKYRITIERIEESGTS